MQRHPFDTILRDAVDTERESMIDYPESAIEEY